MIKTPDHRDDAPPPQLVIRKSFRDLSDPEIAEYVAGCIALKNWQQSDPNYKNVYDFLVYTHYHPLSMRLAHLTPAFLPWHRYFILCFERYMQTAVGNPSFALPYWDWEWDTKLQTQSSSSLWAETFMGPSGMPVRKGPFAKGLWKTPPTDGSLYRDLGTKLDSLPLVSDVMSALSESQYDAKPYNASTASGFRNRLEGEIAIDNGLLSVEELHGRVHGWVGGHMSMVNYSVNDPVFFMHHCNIDRIWALWQSQHPAEYSASTTSYPKDAPLIGTNLNDPMYPWDGASSAATTTPAMMLDYRLTNKYKISKLYCGFNKGDGCIYITSSFDGVNWDTATNPGNLGSYNSPALVDYQGSLYCVWKNGSNGHLNCAFFDGKNWSAPTALQDGGRALNGSPSATAFGDKLICGWSYDGCVYITWYRKSDGRSMCLQPPNAGSNQTPALTNFANNSILFCAYSHDDGCIWTMQSSDGTNWSNPVQPPNIGSYISPALAEYNKKLYLAYADNSGVIFIRSSSDGVSWSDAFNPPNAGSTKAPTLTVYNGLLFLAYTDRNGNFCNVSFNGTTWKDGNYSNIPIADFPALAKGSLLI